MTDEIFYLDLHVAKLYGWETRKDEEQINHYRQLIRDGFEFPPIHICQTGPKEYSLIYGYINPNRKPYEPVFDGGHRRALSYYLENKPIPAVLSSSSPGFSLERRVEISDIKLRRR